MITEEETREYFNNKIKAFIKISEILKTEDGKKYLETMEKAGYKNFLEVSMCSNFGEIYTYINSLYETQNHLINTLQTNSELRKTLVSMIEIIAEKTLELSKEKSTIQSSLKEVSDKIQIMKSDLQNQVNENIKPLSESLKGRIEEQKNDIEVDKMAKEREKWVDYIYG